MAFAHRVPVLVDPTMTTIVIGGDVCPTGNIEKAFLQGSADEIFHDVLDDIASADLSIVNLECPLVSRATPIPKAGPVLGAITSCIQGFVAAKWNVLNLANNHSYDHGADGLRETIRTIEEAGLDVIGAGEDLKDAETPIVKELNGERFVIYSMAEHEFSVADETTPGANPLDLVRLVYAIREHKRQGIFIGTHPWRKRVLPISKSGDGQEVPIHRRHGGGRRHLWTYALPASVGNPRRSANRVWPWQSGL